MFLSTRDDAVKDRAREALLTARTLLADEANWIKDLYAQNANGECVDEFSPQACKFCLLGAIRRGGMRDIFSVRNEAIRMVQAQLGLYDGVISFNDDPCTTHADVLNVLDQAIAALPEGGVS